MSKNLNIEAIVDEVIRRLRKLMNQRKVLLILRDGTNFKTLTPYILNLREAGYDFDILSHLTEEKAFLKEGPYVDMERIRSSIFKVQSYENFLSSYEGILVSEVSYFELREFSKMNFKDALGKLIFYGLKENKKVYGFASEFYGIKNPGLLKKMGETISVLEDISFEVVVSDDVTENAKRDKSSFEEMKPKKISYENRLEQNQSSRRAVNKRTNKKIITLADVSHLKARDSVVLRPDARLTSLAREFLERHQIEVREE